MSLLFFTYRKTGPPLVMFVKRVTPFPMLTPYSQPTVCVCIIVCVNHNVNSSGPSSPNKKSFIALICSSWLIGGNKSLAAISAVLKVNVISGSDFTPTPEDTVPLLNLNQRPTELSLVFICAVKFFSFRRSRKAL